MTNLHGIDDWPDWHPFEWTSVAIGYLMPFFLVMSSPLLRVTNLTGPYRFFNFFSNKIFASRSIFSFSCFSSFLNRNFLLFLPIDFPREAIYSAVNGGNLFSVETGVDLFADVKKTFSGFFLVSSRCLKSLDFSFRSIFGWSTRGFFSIWDDVGLILIFFGDSLALTSRLALISSRYNFSSGERYV